MNDVMNGWAPTFERCSERHICLSVIWNRVHVYGVVQSREGLKAVSVLGCLFGRHYCWEKMARIRSKVCRGWSEMGRGPCHHRRGQCRQL